MMHRNHPFIPALVLCGLLALSSPAMAEVVTFAAGADQISSVGVLDIAENLHGDLFFGTENGLSYYDGEWHIVHHVPWDSRKGLLSDHVLAVEFDGDGNLWMGHPNGLQRLEGGTYITTDDQQLLKALDIHNLRRRGGEMWLSAGSAGIHRYLDGTWRWFPPNGPEGLGCSYVSDMATDPASNTLFVACRDGIWFTDDTGDFVRFSPLRIPLIMQGPVRGIRGDPFGGLYVYNGSAVFHLTPPGTWRLVVTSPDLTPGIDITDLQVEADRTLWIATNNGIYAWRDGAVRDRLDSASGIRSNAVKRIYLDSARRLWFVTPENVGYATIGEKVAGGSSIIPITTFELPTKSPGPDTSPAPMFTPGISIEITPELTPGPSDPLSGLLDGILGFFRKLLGG
jgi:ligand-binding sensor domain-containing protein